MNFRGCSYYQHVLSITSSGQVKKKKPSPPFVIQANQVSEVMSQNAQLRPPLRSFANVVSGHNEPPSMTYQSNTLSLDKVLALLKDVLAALSTAENPRCHNT